MQNNLPLAVFAVADAVRQESREAVQRLHEQQIELIMMTVMRTPSRLTSTSTWCSLKCFRISSNRRAENGLITSPDSRATVSRAGGWPRFLQVRVRIADI